MLDPENFIGYKPGFRRLKLYFMQIVVFFQFPVVLLISVKVGLIIEL
jgi:hypothetical protein